VKALNNKWNFLLLVECHTPSTLPASQPALSNKKEEIFPVLLYKTFFSPLAAA
jgi:hypothetical protein